MNLDHLVEKSSLTAEERTNVAAVERWTELYNSDVNRMIAECYDAECVVDVKGFLLYRGHESFRALEEKVNEVAPRRRAVPEKVIARGDVVVVQASIENPDMGADWKTPFCVVLTFRDGMITRDDSYLDMSCWPSALMSPKQLDELGIERARSFVEMALVAVPGVVVRKVTTLRESITRRLRPRSA